MAFELETTLATGVSGNYWFLGFVEVVCNDDPYCTISMDLYLNRDAKIDGKSIMERRNTRLSLYEIDASVSYDFRACIYNALLQRPEWANAVMIYDDPTQNPKCQDATVSTAMETPVAITIGAYDPYNVPFTFSIVDQPDNGQVNIEMASVDFGAGSLSSPVFTYTPNANFAGVDTFTYTATNDDGIVGNTATITITIPTQIPVAQSFNVSTDMNTSVDFPMAGVDPNDLPLTYNVVVGTTNGSYSVNNNVITYIPDTDYVGSDILKYTASNGTYVSPEATINIVVESTVPVVSDSNFTTSVNVPVQISFTASDPNNLPLTYSIATNPANGSVSEVDGVWTYTPSQDFTGVDTFTFTASNGTNTSQTANITITVG